MGVGYHTAMKFSQLLNSSRVTPTLCEGDADIARVTTDNRNCAPGACFVAIRGTEVDGHKYIASAVAAGASAIVCEDAAAVPDNVPYAAVSDTRAAVGCIGQAFYGWPTKKLINIGITGTNGKTTVAHLIRGVLQSAGYAPAMLGTISYETGVQARPASTTTPDPITLAEMMAEMIRAGRTHLVMEVSSHALDQDRAAGVDFAAAVFTNLTGDHLDYHETMEQYLAAKRRLFEMSGPDCAAVVNAEDAAGATIADAAGGKVIMYGLNTDADLAGSVRSIDITGAKFAMNYDGRAVSVSTPLIGRHNLMNCLAAAGACLSLGMDLNAVATGLGATSSVPGRLQRVDVPAAYRVFVDYAHTDDALSNVLGSLRPLTSGRLVVIFGCGGDRDRSKRPRMAAVAEKLADHVVITSDNPRSESPDAIIADVVAGLTDAGRKHADIIVDRREAISAGIAAAGAGDVVLIAGKGHENYQITGDERIHFDDVEEAQQAMQCREAGR